MSNAVTVHNDARSIQFSGDFNSEQKQLLKRTICKGSSDDEFNLFTNICKRSRLDPFARQIYAVKRWDAKENREVMSVQTSIDGFRLIAERSGQYAGQVGPLWCGEDGVWTDVWLKKQDPVASKVGVIRHDFREVCWAVARFDAYAQKNKLGQSTPMWAKMPDLMIAKCAEALALRKAFPQDLSGLYTQDEMSNVETVPETIPNEGLPQPETVVQSKAELPKPTSPFVRKVESSVEEDLGEYVVQVGKKFKGKKLKEVDIMDLNDTVTWIIEQNEKEGKSPAPSTRAFLEKAEAYLLSMETPISHINKNEEIPF